MIIVQNNCTSIFIRHGSSLCWYIVFIYVQNLNSIDPSSDSDQTTKILYSRFMLQYRGEVVEMLLVFSDNAGTQN